MPRFSREEVERRRTAEAGFWKEMEERGLSRVDAFMVDAHYGRLNEIRRGLITQEDFERMRRKTAALLSTLPPRVPEWVEEEEAAYYRELGRKK